MNLVLGRTGISKTKNIMRDDATPYPLDETQKNILDLAAGRKIPENAEEREMLRDIEECRAKGYMIDLPFE